MVVGHGVMPQHKSLRLVPTCFRLSENERLEPAGIRALFQRLEKPGLTRWR